MLPGAHQPDAMGEEVSPGNFLDWRQQTLLRANGRLGSRDAQPHAGQASRRVRAAQVTPGALAADEPLYGRLFLPTETADARLAILSYGFWKAASAAIPASSADDPALRLSFPIVGVMPPDFRFPQATSGLGSVPLHAGAVADRQGRWICAVRRLTDGVHRAP
jgi:hypothetical protein